ncbi:MAG: hypothetical protein Ta2B_07130 [Termitinemataceae bacterium]|nr:MAG: hypothetical protein Ta2B_07130 [Termitinemataceae bacterium]
MFFTFSLSGIFAASNKGNYFIYNVRFDIEGITKPYALLRSAEIRKGEYFYDIIDLEDYIKRKKQILKNQRTLENADIEYTEVGKDRWGRVMIDLLIHSKDTHNFLIFPEPKYSSSNGVRLALKLRDNNFLGTNSPFRVNLEWRSPNLFVKEKTPYEQDSLSLGFSADIPFFSANYNWIFSFDNTFKYFFKNDNLPSNIIFNNSTGLSLEIPLARTTFGLGYIQGVTINQEYEKWKKHKIWEKDHVASNIESIWYLTSSGFLNWRAPLWLYFEALNELTYNIRGSAGINYASTPLDDDRSGGSVHISQSLGFDKIDWEENFRKGFNITVSNDIAYGFLEDRWINALHTNIESHFALGDIAGISFRTFGLHNFDDAFKDDDRSGRLAGYLLRGVSDEILCADTMITLNMDFSFLVFRFTPSTWGNKKSRNSKSTKLFDFEIHLGPSFDLGIVRGQVVDKKLEPLKEMYFDPDFWIYTAGAEVMVYPLAFRSFFLRFSIAWNLSTAIPGHFGNFEIDLSTGHFY